MDANKILSMAREVVAEALDDKPFFVDAVEAAIYEACKPFAAASKPGKSILESGTLELVTKAMLRAAANTSQITLLGTRTAEEYSEDYIAQASEKLQAALSEFSEQWKARKKEQQPAS